MEAESTNQRSVKSIAQHIRICAVVLNNAKRYPCSPIWSTAPNVWYQGRHTSKYCISDAFCPTDTAFSINVRIPYGLRQFHSNVAAETVTTFLFNEFSRRCASCGPLPFSVYGFCCLDGGISGSPPRAFGPISGRYLRPPFLPSSSSGPAAGG